jgi:tetratricopeptide (TPR) repeat protein
MTDRKAFRHWTLLCSLVFALSALCVGAGCSKVFLGKKPDVEKNWTCDNEADEAMKRNDYAAGISLHERFLEKDPENALALYHLGYAYGQIGEHQREVSHYEKAISFGYKRDLIFFNLGMAYGDPRHVEARLLLSMLYADWGELQMAADQLRKVLEIDPTNARARKFLERIERE